nr:acidic protein msyB [Raoultella sp. NCTC 9187]
MPRSKKLSMRPAKEYLANNPESDEESANVEQLNIQKYVLQDGDIAWQGRVLCRR